MVKKNSNWCKMYIDLHWTLFHYSSRMFTSPMHAHSFASMHLIHHAFTQIFLLFHLLLFFPQCILGVNSMLCFLPIATVYWKILHSMLHPWSSWHADKPLCVINYKRDRWGEVMCTRNCTFYTDYIEFLLQKTFIARQGT